MTDMNAQDKELDDIRRQWQTMKLDNERLREANLKLSQQLSTQKACDKQRKLAAFYKRIGITSMVALPMLAFPLSYVLNAPLWLCLMYGGMGLVFGVMDLCFASFVEKTDYITMPVCEAMVHAQLVILWQARLRAIAMALAAVVLFPLFFHIDAMGERHVMYGAVVGLVIGLALGLLMYYDKRRMAKKMLADLECED